MYLIYCIITSFITSLIYEYSGLKGLGLKSLALSFVLILLINFIISNPKKHYKRNIMIFSCLVTILSVCNAIKVRFQLAEISFFDIKLAKAAGDVAGLFIDKLPYAQICILILSYVFLALISFKFEMIFKKIKDSKSEENQKIYDDKMKFLDEFFSKKLFKIAPLFLVVSFFIFTNPISKNFTTSSFGNLLISGKSLFVSYADSLKPIDSQLASIFKQIDQDPLSKKDENDVLLKDYPFNKQNDIDVIIFQSETFFDLPKYQDKLGKNGIVIHDEHICDNFRYYQNNGVSGKLYTPVVGGGTVNTEYEMMTGYGVKYYPPGSIVFTTVLKEKTNSLAWYMKNVVGNTTTIAIHNHTKEYWDRDRVYPLLGIDNFIYMDMFTKQQQEDLVGAWMSDKTIFDMTKKQLEENAGSNIFILPVTVQNHGPFIGAKGPMQIDNLSKHDDLEIRHYASNIKYSDEQLKIFMDYLDSRKKPTIMVFYGDHKPDPNYDMFKDSKYYNENDKQNLFYTDYFVYFNKAVKDPKLLALKGKQQNMSAAAMNRFVQILLGDSSKESMYIYNYAKDPKNYFNKNCIQGIESSPFRDISLNFVNKYIEYNNIK